MVDPETLRDVEDGQQGLILAKGPGVLRGYHHDESATAKVRRRASGRGSSGAQDLGVLAQVAAA